MTAIAPFTARASVQRGTFTAEILADGQTPAEAFAILNNLLKQMRLKAPRGKKYAHLAPVVQIDLHSRVDVLDNAAEYAERDAAHRQELAQHAHGLHYALCDGTPELFTAEPDPVQFQNEIPAEPEPAPVPAPKPRQPRRSRHTRITVTVIKPATLESPTFQEVI